MSYFVAWIWSPAFGNQGQFMENEKKNEAYWFTLDILH